MNEEIEKPRNTDDGRDMPEDRFYEECDGYDCYDPGIHELLIQWHREEQAEKRRAAKYEDQCAAPSPVPEPYAPHEKPAGAEANDEVSVKHHSGGGEQPEGVCRWCDHTPCTEECMCDGCLAALRELIPEDPNYDEQAALEEAAMRAEGG